MAIKRDGLADAVSREICNLILGGELAPGDWLPAQAKLAARFGVALSTVREAINGLAVQGILNPHPGRGTLISPAALPLLRLRDLSLARLEGLDLKRLFDARKTIEVALTGFAAQQASEEDLVQIQQALDRMRETLDDERAFIEADLEFHLAVAKAGHNPLLETFYYATRDLLAEATIKTRGYYEEPPQVTLRNQEEILAAIRSHEPVAARQRAAAHFMYWDRLLDRMSELS